MRSKASVLFGMLPTGDLCHRLSKPNSTIESYKSGARRPPQPLRKEIARQFPHIQPEMWDEAEPLPAALFTPGKIDASKPVTAATTQEMANRLGAHVQQLIDDFEAQTGEVTSKTKQLGALAELLTQLQKLTGSHVTERQIIDNPHFVKVVHHVNNALANCPNPCSPADAMRAAASALEELRGT